MTRRPPRLALLSLLAATACTGTAPSVAPPAAPPQQDLEDVSRFAEPHVPPLAPIPGTTGPSAEACGQCHAEIAAEWQASTHAAAWEDPQFQAELHKDPAIGWICLNCHTPLQDQQPEVVTYAGSVRTAPRTPNPGFDTALRDDGITCLTCHWREDGIAAVHADVEAPHPTVLAPELRANRTCTVCHEAQARVEDTLVCTFSTGTEWSEAAPDRTCPACHMPRVTRASAPGAPVREGGRHFFPGSGLPKRPWTPEQAALHATWAPGTAATLDLPPAARPGETVTATLRLENVRAGHKLPTGDPERHYLLHLAVTAEGRTLATGEARVGQTWEWWPEARKRGDDRPAPGESRDLVVPFPMPPGPVQVAATVEHVRISDENADYHGLEGYVRRRTVHALQAQVQPAGPPP